MALNLGHVNRNQELYAYGWIVTDGSMLLGEL